MNIHDFDTYRLDELADIYVNEINPESMTVPYGCEHIKDKRIKNICSTIRTFLLFQHRRKT